MSGTQKITAEQRREIIILAGMRTGTYHKWPIGYIAAVYGVSKQWVCMLRRQAGLPVREHWRSGWRRHVKRPYVKRVGI